MMFLPLTSVLKLRMHFNCGVYLILVHFNGCVLCTFMEKSLEYRYLHKIVSTHKEEVGTCVPLASLDRNMYFPHSGIYSFIARESLYRKCKPF